MNYEFDNKTIVINGLEYPLDPEVWKCTIAISKEKDGYRQAIATCLDYLEQNHDAPVDMKIGEVLNVLTKAIYGV